MDKKIKKNQITRERGSSMKKNQATKSDKPAAAPVGFSASYRPTLTFKKYSPEEEKRVLGKLFDQVAKAKKK
jgi:hypothetical protein